MESRRILCHVCHEVQRDRWTYRNHLLRVHGQVIRGGTSTPVRLVGRELEEVWSADYVQQLDASSRREAMGLPRFTDQEAARRLHDNRIRRERRGRAVARARAYVQQRAARQRAARPSSTPPRRRHSRVAPPPSTSALRPIYGPHFRPAISGLTGMSHLRPTPIRHVDGAQTACVGSRTTSQGPSETILPFVPHAPPLDSALPLQAPLNYHLRGLQTTR